MGPRRTTPSETDGASASPTRRAPRGDQNGGEWQAKRGARTSRGEERRSELLDAAEKVFRETTYEDVRVADISAEAGTSHGTFYKYFTSKEEAFLALAERIQDELLSGHGGGEAEDGSVHDLHARIEAGNRRFLESFKRYANIMVVLDYATTLQPPLKDFQREFRGRATSRIERRIEQWQAEGLVDDRLEPHYAAHALAGMVSRFAYLTYVFDEDFSDNKTVRQLTILWANALGLPAPSKSDQERPGPARSALAD